MSTGQAVNKKGFFSLKTKDLGQAQPAHRKAQTQSGSYGRMLVLGPGRTGSGKGSGSRSKMAVPKPVNLPSLKAETGAMTPLAPSASTTSSWKSADEPAPSDGAGARPAWGDSPAPGQRSNHATEFPALGEDEEEVMAERQRVTKKHPALVERNRFDNDYDRHREWSNPRGPSGDRYEDRGGYGVTGGYSRSPNSPPRVEPGAFMIKKRAEGSAKETVAPVERKTETVAKKTVAKSEEEDGDFFTPDQGKIIWSLEEGDEMDFSQPLKFGDEEQVAANVETQGSEIPDDDEDMYVPRQDLSDSQDDELQETTRTTNERQDNGESKELEPTADEVRAEQEALEERRREITERREEELRRMRALEEEREHQKRELDRLRQEEDARRRAEEDEERRVVAERGQKLESRGFGGSKDYGRGAPRGEVRSLFNPKDPNRPIVVRSDDPPVAKRQSNTAKPQRKERQNRDGEREPSPSRDKSRDRSRDRPVRDKQHREEAVPYRSSRSLVEPNAVVVDKRPARAVKEKKKTRKDKDKTKQDGGKAVSNSATTASAPAKVAAAVVPPKPVEPPVPETPAWTVSPTVVKTLAEIQREEQEREKAEAMRKAHPPAVVASPPTKNKQQERKEKKKKDQKERKAAKQQLLKEEKLQAKKQARVAAAENKKQAAAANLKAASSPLEALPNPTTTNLVDPSGATFSTSLGRLAPLIPASIDSANASVLLPSQQRRLFERGPEEDDDVIDTFHLERNIDAVTAEEPVSVGPSSSSASSSSSSSSSSVRAPAVVGSASASSSQNRTRFTESALAASAFTPSKFGMAPLPEAAFTASTWAPQTSQLDSESLYSSGSEGSRYTNLFGAPGGTGHASPFAAPPFGSAYGSAQWGGSAGGNNNSGSSVSGAPESTESGSRLFLSDPNVSVPAPSSRNGDAWGSESVFALPPHILSESEPQASRGGRQPLMMNSNPEEFVKFLERATFTPQSAKPLSAAEPSIGGKPLSTLAASPPAFVLGAPLSAPQAQQTQARMQAQAQVRQVQPPRQANAGSPPRTGSKKTQSRGGAKKKSSASKKHPKQQSKDSGGGDSK